MPTSADLLLDTSAAVVLCLASAADRAVVVRRTRGAVLGLAGHAAFETYSVLTRLPGEQRLSSASALQVIQRNFPRTHELSIRRARGALAEFARVGIAGGSVYDGLVGLAAQDAGVLLLTRDRRALETYTRLGVTVEVV